MGNEQGIAVTTNFGGAGKWDPSYQKYGGGEYVIIFGDNDDAGRKHVRDVARNLAPVAEWVKVIEFPDLPEKADVSDWLDLHSDNEGDLRDQLVTLIEKAPHWKETEEQATRTSWSIDMDELLEMEIPERRPLLIDGTTKAPVLYASSLNQLFAFRGHGKTAVAHSLLRAMVNGERSLRVVRRTQSTHRRCGASQNSTTGTIASIRETSRRTSACNPSRVYAARCALSNSF